MENTVLYKKFTNQINVSPLCYTAKWPQDSEESAHDSHWNKKQAVLEKVAKVATKNRQNRHMAEFRQTKEMKVVEHQILSEKLVSQAWIDLLSAENEQKCFTT